MKTLEEVSYTRKLEQFRPDKIIVRFLSHTHTEATRSAYELAFPKTFFSFATGPSLGRKISVFGKAFHQF